MSKASVVRFGGVWSRKRITNTEIAAIKYDVAPDGKRIAALMPVESPEAQQSQGRVISLENFTDERQRKSAHRQVSSHRQ